MELSGKGNAARLFSGGAVRRTQAWVELVLSVLTCTNRFAHGRAKGLKDTNPLEPL